MVIIQIVAFRNNLETAYLWLIETAKTTGRCKHRNTGASTGIDRNTGESRRNAPEYTVCVNVYDVCVCSVWLYFVFNVSRTN